MLQLPASDRRLFVHSPPAARLAFISGRGEREYVLDASPDHLNDNTISEYR
jgi:hypothetical protein